MADTASRVAAHPHTHSPLYLRAVRSPQAWVRRRARRLQRFYAISRREAVDSAWEDWVCFQPIAARSGAVH